MDEKVKLYPDDAKLVLEMLRKRVGDYLIDIERLRDIIRDMERQMKNPQPPVEVVDEEPWPEPPPDWKDDYLT